MTRVYKIHMRDPNFPAPILTRIKSFLGASRLTMIYSITDV